MVGRGLAALGLAPGEEVTEAQLRNLFGERGRHPDADRIEADRLAADDSPKKAYRAGPVRKVRPGSVQCSREPVRGNPAVRACAGPAGAGAGSASPVVDTAAGSVK